MPRAPKRCGAPDCPERITGQTYCPAHEREQRDRSTWGRGSTRQSRRIREQVLHLLPVCYLAYDGCTIRSTQDDHVIPRSQGGSDDVANRRGVCTHCHRIKSQAEAAHARRQSRPRPAE